MNRIIHYTVFVFVWLLSLDLVLSGSADTVACLGTIPSCGWMTPHGTIMPHFVNLWIFLGCLCFLLIINSMNTLFTLCACAHTQFISPYCLGCATSVLSFLSAHHTCSYCAVAVPFLVPLAAYGGWVSVCP